ncbi:MAG: glycosyltransferase family 2 protein [Pseudomonadota bacterium]
MFTVITVSFNASDLIANCIQSVNEQDYPNIEHVFIDGGSTDGTVEIIKAQSAKRTYLQSKPDWGIYDAMNIGIARAKGQYIAIINADDRLADPFVLSKVAETFECSDAKIVFGGLQFETSEGKPMEVYVPKAFQKGQSFRKAWQAAHPAMFVRKEAYNEGGVFNTSYAITADLDLQVRFLEVLNFKSARVDKVLAVMRVGGVSGRLNSKFRAVFETVLIFSEQRLFDQGLQFMWNRYKYAPQALIKYLRRRCAKRMR